MSVTKPSSSEHGNMLPGLDALGVHTVARVLKHLTGTQCAQLACLSRTFRAAADDDKLWNDYYHNEYPKCVYQRERKLIGLREAGCVINFRYLYASKGQAKRFWRRVECWKNNEFNVLRKGASEKALQAAEQLLGFPLPLHVKEVYRRHDGQNSTRKTRSVDIQSIIKNFVNVPWWHLPSQALVDSRLVVALPLFLDLEKALSSTVDMRRYFFLMSRYRNYRENIGRNMKSENGWTVARNVIFSSIAFAKLSFQSLTQFLLLKCDTQEVYLFEYPSLLIQIPTKSIYDWFVPWIEGYTGFDENGHPCEVPLSWYFVKDNDQVLQLQKECPNKRRNLFTFRECTTCESSSLSGLPLESNEAFIGANPCAILSRISGGLVYNISTIIRPLSDALINYNAFEIVVSLHFTPLISDEAEAEDLKDQSLKDVIALKQSNQQGPSHTSGLGIKHHRELLFEDTESRSKHRKTMKN